MWADGLRCFNNLNNTLTSLEWTLSLSQNIFAVGSMQHLQVSLEPAVKRRRRRSGMIPRAWAEGQALCSLTHTCYRLVAGVLWMPAEKTTKGPGKATSWLFWEKTLPFGKRMAEKSIVNVFLTWYQDTCIRYSLKFEKGGWRKNFFKDY